MNREKIQALKDLSDLLEKERISRTEFDTQKQLILKPQNKFLLLIRSFSFFSRSISPQMIILILIILFYSPIKNLILNASEVGFGDIFSVKVEQALRVADPSLAQNLKELTEEELIVLMSAGSSYLSMVYVDQNTGLVQVNSYYPYYQSLYDKKLMQTKDNTTEVLEILSSKDVAENKPLYSDSLISNAMPVNYSISDFTKEELKKVDDLAFGLSPQGKDVLRVIIRVASEEISTLN